MASFVIDASATLPWCFDDEATAHTEGLLNRCAGGEEVMLASVRLRIHVEPFTTQQAVRDVKQLAQTHQLTAYDAAYLELALRYNLPLATLDIELKQAACAVGVRLIE